MTSVEERARTQYKTNSLAKVLVVTICEQLEIPPTTGSALMILAHDGLLSMLELGHSEMTERTRAALVNPSTIIPKGEIWLPK